MINAFYTHTVPPDNPKRDCMRLVTNDLGHLASRSYHTGGVNLTLADGSVRFVRDSVALDVWIGLSLRAGEEVPSLD